MFLSFTTLYRSYFKRVSKIFPLSNSTLSLSIHFTLFEREENVRGRTPSVNELNSFEMSFQASNDESNPHLALTNKGAKVFIVD